MKNKTLAVWITLLLGPIGGHRVYLLGKFDSVAAALLLSSTAGLYGVMRARSMGVDDQASWLLVPWLGFALAASCLTAIVYGLTDSERWNQRYNPTMPADTLAGHSNWLTVFGLAASLLIGATALLSSIAFSFQRYFEYEADRAHATAIWAPLSAKNNKIHRTQQT